MTRIIGRSAAKERGLERYFTGIPCACGHVAEQYVRDDRCCECNPCSRAEAKAKQPTSTQKARAALQALKELGIEV